MGDLMVGMGRGKDAEAFFRKDLEIAERLAAQEPGRADLQTDLAVSLVKMAQVLPASAAHHLERALESLRTLQAEGRLSPDKAGWIAEIEEALKTSILKSG